MYTFEISIKVSNNKHFAEALDQFILLSGSYRGSGQTVGRDTKRYYADGVIAEVVYCHELTSLNIEYNNYYVNLRKGLLEELCGNELQFKQLGSIAEDLPVCNCTKSDFYLLTTNYVSQCSPIKCGSCFEVIPLYKLPAYYDYGYQPVLSWETNYQSCDSLQMNCEVGEEWALEQMQDPGSELSQLGRGICSKIEEQASTPTYYYLHNYRELTVEEQIDSLCPSCNGEWLLMQPLADGMFNYRCDSCRLLSSFSPNIPD